MFLLNTLAGVYKADLFYPDNCYTANGKSYMIHTREHYPVLEKKPVMAASSRNFTERNAALEFAQYGHVFVTPIQCGSLFHILFTVASYHHAFFYTFVAHLDVKPVS